MKKLSVEEKAKAYDKAIEVIRKCETDKYGCVIGIKPSDIFHELAESEDEKIRKALIKAIKMKAFPTSTCGGELFICGQSSDKCIAWLEKQGEPVEINPSEFDLRLNRLLVQFESLTKEELASSLGFYLNVVKNGWPYKIEKKQGEQNPYSGVSFEYNGHTWGLCGRDGGVEILMDSELKAFVSVDKSFIYPIHHQPIIAPKSAMEAIKGEKVDNANKVEPKDYSNIDPHFFKTTDKVEPKFHEGEWVVWDNKISCYVDNIYQGKESLMYTITDTNNMIRSYSVKGFDNNARLWTIHDAKDGDVLYSPSHHLIWIYKDNEHYYACVNMNYVTKNIATNGLIFIPNDACPATKDEQTILFARMEEAGHEWDAKKKELKEIEHKHFCELDNSCACVKFPFKAKVKSSGTIVAIHGGQLSPDGKEWIKYQSDAEDGYKIYEPNNLELFSLD